MVAESQLRTWFCSNPSSGFRTRFTFLHLTEAAWTTLQGLQGRGGGPHALMSHAAKLPQVCVLASHKLLQGVFGKMMGRWAPRTISRCQDSPEKLREIDKCCRAGDQHNLRGAAFRAASRRLSRAHGRCFWDQHHLPGTPPPRIPHPWQGPVGVVKGRDPALVLG